MLATTDGGCAHRNEGSPVRGRPPTRRCCRAAQAAGRTPGLRSRMSDHTACVVVGARAGPSSTAWRGSSHAWHTIQIGPGSEIGRSSRWRSPQSSQVMVTLIATAASHCGCDGPRARTSPPGYRPATNRRHRAASKGRKARHNAAGSEASRPLASLRTRHRRVLQSSGRCRIHLRRCASPSSLRARWSSLKASTACRLHLASIANRHGRLRPSAPPPRSFRGSAASFPTGMTDPRRPSDAVVSVSQCRWEVPKEKLERDPGP